MTRDYFTVPLLGGLGNQLFQYFAGVYLEEKFDRNLVLFTSHPSVRRNQSNIVAIHDLPFTRRHQFIEHKLRKTDRKFLGLAIRVSTGQVEMKKLKSWSCSTYFRLQTKKEFRFDLGISNNLGYSNLSSMERKSLIVGYFQTFYYFNEVLKSNSFNWSAEIKNSLTRLAKSELPIPENSTLLHIRRSDYIGNKFGLLSSNYYESAIEKLTEKKQIGNLYLVSDGTINDLNFLPNSMQSKVKYLETRNKSAAEVLAVISRFENIIVANSSLSWWGATLGELIGNTKLVLAPDPWFQKMSPPNNIIPDHWVTIRGDIWEI